MKEADSRRRRAIPHEDRVQYGNETVFPWLSELKSCPFADEKSGLLFMPFTSGAEQIARAAAWELSLDASTARMYRPIGPLTPERIHSVYTNVSMRDDEAMFEVIDPTHGPVGLVSCFNIQPAPRYSAESILIARRGEGIGYRSLCGLYARMQQLGFPSIEAKIDRFNVASLALHRKFPHYEFKQPENPQIQILIDLLGWNEPDSMHIIAL